MDQSRAAVAYGLRAVPRLFEELRGPGTERRLRALNTLRDLLHDPERLYQTVTGGFMSELAPLLRDPDPAVRTRTCDLLHQLTAHSIGRRTLLSSSLLAPLSLLLDDLDGGCRVAAHRVLNRLVLLPSGAEALLSLVPKLMLILREAVHDTTEQQGGEEEELGGREEDIGGREEELGQKEELGSKEEELGGREEEIEDKEEEIGGKEEEIGSKEEQLGQKEELGQKDEGLGDKDEELGGKEEEVVGNEEVGGKEEELGGKKEELDNKEEEIGSKEEELGGKEELGHKEEDLGGKEQELESKEEELGGKEKELESKEEEVGGKDAQEELENKEETEELGDKGLEVDGGDEDTEKESKEATEEGGGEDAQEELGGKDEELGHKDAQEEEGEHEPEEVKEEEPNEEKVEGDKEPGNIEVEEQGDEERGDEGRGSTRGDKDLEKDKLKSPADAEEELVLLLSTLASCSRCDALPALASDGVALLRRALCHRSGLVRREAAAAMMALSVPLEGKRLVCSLGVLSVVMEMLQDPDIEVRVNAAGVFMNALIITAGKTQSVDLGAVPVLLDVVCSEELSAASLSRPDPVHRERTQRRKALALYGLRCLAALSEAPAARRLLLQQRHRLERRADTDPELRRATQTALQVIDWTP